MVGARPGSARQRTTARAPVTLREVTADTVRQVCRLGVTTEQASYVAPNAISIAQAYFEPAAWFRAVCVGDEPVGFAMLYDPTRAAAPDDGPGVCWLWRFMIDAMQQRHGYGDAAMTLLIAHVRTLPGVHTFRLSFVPGTDSPRDFYVRHGFRETGAVDGDEIVMELPLTE
jgi:diamine N-acetyltransferase